MLAPETGYRRRTYLALALERHRMMNPKERVTQIGNRVDVGTQRLGCLAGVKVQALEWKNTIVFRKAEVSCNLVCVQARSVDDVPGRNETPIRFHAGFSTTEISGVRKDIYPELLRVGDKRLHDFPGIDTCGRGREQGALVHANARFYF